MDDWDRYRESDTDVQLQKIRQELKDIMETFSEELASRLFKVVSISSRFLHPSANLLTWESEIILARILTQHRTHVLIVFKSSKGFDFPQVPAPWSFAPSQLTQACSPVSLCSSLSPATAAMPLPKSEAKTSSFCVLNNDIIILMYVWVCMCLMEEVVQAQVCAAGGQRASSSVTSLTLR